MAYRMNIPGEARAAINNEFLVKLYLAYCKAAEIEPESTHKDILETKGISQLANGGIHIHFGSKGDLSLSLYENLADLLFVVEPTFRNDTPYQRENELKHETVEILKSRLPETYPINQNIYNIS